MGFSLEDFLQVMMKMLFADYSPLTEKCYKFFVPTDRETGQPRGFAFLEMSKESGVSAVGALDQITIEDRVIKCNEQLSKEELANRKESRANEGVKIYVGNVSFETTKEQLV